jgi:hypothetical protein
MGDYRLDNNDVLRQYVIYTLRQKGYPAFQKTLGALERARICNPSGFFRFFRREKPLKVLANLKVLKI